MNDRQQGSINRAAEQPVLTAKGERADRILGRLCECSDNSVKMPYASMRRAADGNKSVYDFLKENHQKLDFMEHTGNNSDDYNKHRYIVVDPKITETKKRNPAKDFDTVRSINPLRPGAVSWEKNTVSDVTETIKVVDIYDPACKVQDLVIRTYESYQKGNKAGELTRNCVNQSHNYVTISGHTPTNEDRLGVNDQGQLIVRGYKEKITEVLKGVGNGFLDKLKSLITMK